MIELQEWTSPPMPANENISSCFKDKNADITITRSTIPGTPHVIQLWVRPRNVQGFDFYKTVKFLRDNPELHHRTHKYDVYIWFEVPATYDDQDIDECVDGFVDSLKDLSIFPMVNAYQ